MRRFHRIRIWPGLALMLLGAFPIAGIGHRCAAQADDGQPGTAQPVVAQPENAPAQDTQSKGALVEFTEEEFAAPPTAERLRGIEDAARSAGWKALVPALRQTAVGAYRTGQPAAAEGWLHVYRWAALFATTIGESSTQWYHALAASHLVASGRPTVSPQALGSLVTPEVQAWLLENAAFSSEFFSTVSPLDLMPNVLMTLNSLYRADPARFAHYDSLALAIAVDYDIGPPPSWPHAQVGADALKRQLPKATAAFDWWTREDRARRTYQRLDRLRADELKFVVDAAAPFSELTWSQQAVGNPLSHFDKTYSMVLYRKDRVQANVLVWSGVPYTLQGILAAGGICVDQAYFACEAGKARGIPTLLFYGSGASGRHAWFGYLDDKQTWKLDAGRFAEQRFVVGHAIDPQTWTEISDHEIQFLSERFRTLPSYHNARIQAEFAMDFYSAGDFASSALAARSAVNFEPRILEGWEILILAETKRGMEPVSLEGLLHEAAYAFQRYPDLEISYVNRIGASLRARGQTSQADFEERSLANRLAGTRSDLAAQKAQDILIRSMGAEALDAQVRTFESLLQNFGEEGGMAFFDKVVTVFLEHLSAEGKPADAVQLADKVRETMKIEEGTQLDAEMKALAERVSTARPSYGGAGADDGNGGP